MNDSPASKVESLQKGLHLVTANTYDCKHLEPKALGQILMTVFSVAKGFWFCFFKSG